MVLTRETGMILKYLVPEVLELGDEAQLEGGLDGGEDEGAEDEVKEAAQDVDEEAAPRSHPGGGSTVVRLAAPERPHHRLRAPLR